jgi:hypothetical protein
MKIAKDQFIAWIKERYGADYGERCKNLLVRETHVSDPSEVLDAIHSATLADSQRVLPIQSSGAYFATMKFDSHV